MLLKKRKTKKDSKSKKLKKVFFGFSLIEILITISIIGILSSVVLSSVQSLRGKAQKSAFKKEMDGLQKSLVIACDSGAIVIDDFSSGRHWTKPASIDNTLSATSSTIVPDKTLTVLSGGDTGGNCGSSSLGTFLYHIQSDNIPACWAELSNDAAKFSTDCN